MKNNNFSKYQLLFNTSLNDILNKQGLSNDLYNMITYALNGGKRLRPIISIDMCLSLGGKLEDVINFAVAIELIHVWIMMIIVEIIYHFIKNFLNIRLKLYLI